MMVSQKGPVNPWFWIPSLYFAEGLPYILVMTVSVVMYKRLGISNTDIAFYTSWLYLPWVIKPFWSPLIELLKSKRWWIVGMQLTVGIGLAGIALTLPTSFFFKGTLAFFWLLAFSSATHDIAADGFYMMGLDENKQTFFVGIRTTFYRIAMIFGQGLLVIFAGYLENLRFSAIQGENEPLQSIPLAWSITFITLSLLFLIFTVYHSFILPHPVEDTIQTNQNLKSVWKGFKETVVTFFNKKEIWTILAFLLFYRLGESQLLKMASPFLLDGQEKGGLALTTTEVGLVYGTCGLIALITGGLLGGWIASIYGLKRLLWIFVIFMNIPNLVYVYLSLAQPHALWMIISAVAVEQLGYGFGFTAYTLFMLYTSEGKHKTAHYAFCTGFMALGMMIPGMASGWLQELWGYQSFFIWVMVCTIPGFIVARLIRIEKNFGIKKAL
jgi:MFS transporter, PAT family, beta-lactamase induction signal transducer AmpG